MLLRTVLRALEAVAVSANVVLLSFLSVYLTAVTSSYWTTLTVLETPIAAAVSSLVAARVLRKMKVLRRLAVTAGNAASAAMLARYVAELLGTKVVAASLVMSVPFVLVLLFARS